MKRKNKPNLSDWIVYLNGKRDSYRSLIVGALTVFIAIITFAVVIWTLQFVSSNLWLSYANTVGEENISKGVAENFTNFSEAITLYRNISLFTVIIGFFIFIMVIMICILSSIQVNRLINDIMKSEHPINVNEIRNRLFYPMKSNQDKLNKFITRKYKKIMDYFKKKKS